MGRTIAEVSENTLKVEAYLKICKDGQELSYLNIEEETGVKMDNKGKGNLRSALKRLKKEYSPIRGYGIRLADADSTMGIISHRLRKVDNAVKRGEKTHKNLQSQFFDSLSKEEQNQVLYVGAVFGAIRVASENGRLIYSSKTKKISGEISIPIPKLE